MLERKGLTEGSKLLKKNENWIRNRISKKYCVEGIVHSCDINIEKIRDISKLLWLSQC